MCMYIWSLLLFCTPLFYVPTNAGTFSLDTQNNCFLKDGKPWQYISGSVHYFRIHPDLWEDRLQRIRAMGLNAIQIYTAWVLHEPTPGNFDFASPGLNVTRFFELAQKYNLAVLLRPGPYICAEFDFGALPWWLLNIDGIQLRTYEENYINAVTSYMNTLLDIVKPFTYKNGGPVVMVQVENEYGVLGACNYTYTAYLRKLIWTKLGNDTVVYNTDQTNEHAQTCGGFGSGLATVDFGPTSNSNIDSYFKLQQEHVRITPGIGGGPKVVSEYWVTGSPYWAQPHPFTYDIEQIVGNLQYMHSINASINIYMIYAGTNFGFMNGGYVNWEGGIGKIATNYGMCSPIAQNGDITPEYTAIRSFIQNLTNWENPPLDIPANNPVSAYGQVTLTRIGSNLITTLTQLQEPCVSSTYPLTFEQINHGFGYVLYTSVLKSSGTTLNVPSIKDYGYVFVNNNYKAMVGWNLVNSIAINANQGDVLRILVENGGRENYWSGWLPDLEFRGLFNVSLDGTLLSDWYQCGINLTETSINSLSNNQLFPKYDVLAEKATSQPGVFIGTFNANPLEDTFFDSTGWGKGQLFINGFNLGRYWPQAGPEMTLYVPKPILQPKNTVVLIELVGAQQNYVNFTDHPIYYWKGYTVNQWGCIWT